MTEAVQTEAPSTAARVLAALQARYGRDKGWALFSEVTTKECDYVSCEKEGFKYA